MYSHSACESSLNKYWQASLVQLFLKAVDTRLCPYRATSHFVIIEHKKIFSLLQFCRIKWTASSEFVTYRLCEQRRFRQACASAQSRQNLHCSLIQAMSQEEPSDRKPDPWPVWMAGHAQLKFVMTECSKTQIRLTGLKWLCFQL